MSDLFLHKRILKADERALDEIVTTFGNRSDQLAYHNFWIDFQPNRCLFPVEQWH